MRGIAGRGPAVRVAVAAMMVAVAVPSLAGCESRSCVSWASFADPDDAYRQADVVLVGTVSGRDGVLDTEFGQARAYRIAVERVVKGTVAPTRGSVRVAALPDSCGPADGYGGTGDQLESAGRVLLYASTGHGALATLAPGQGVVAFPVGSALPFGR